MTTAEMQALATRITHEAEDLRQALHDYTGPGEHTAARWAAWAEANSTEFHSRNTLIDILRFSEEAQEEQHATQK